MPPRPLAGMVARHGREPKFPTMSGTYDDPKEIAKAKALAAGPYGELTAKFPLLYAKAAFFGPRPSRDKPAEINSGSVTLLRLDSGPMAVTCDHVVSGFEERRAADKGAIFQIGHVDLDPVAQLIDRNFRIDLATIRLTEEQAKAITSEGEIGSSIYRPWDWPPPMPKRGEFVAFGGFPGALRTVVSFDELVFGSWSSAGSEVSSTSEFQFASVFEREYWINSFGSKNHMELTALGGMSGGPVLIKRKIAFELIGIVRAYSEDYDTVFLSSIRSIRGDGTIEPPPH